MSQRTKDILIANIAMQLYRSEVHVVTRARRFDPDDKMEASVYGNLLRDLDSPFWMLKLTADLAISYIGHAMDRFGREAAERVRRALGDTGCVATISSQTLLTVTAEARAAIEKDREAKERYEAEVAKVDEAAEHEEADYDPITGISYGDIG